MISNCEGTNGKDTPRIAANRVMVTFLKYHRTYLRNLAINEYPAMTVKERCKVFDYLDDYCTNLSEQFENE